MTLYLFQQQKEIIMLELTPQEKSKLNYIRLYEEQIIFKLNQTKQTTFKKLMLWITK